jgi:EAL domain-containing protein (putative c-di-GMP-specific phosphodiesterase class I)
VASLNSLRRLPVRTLKLDPSFFGHLDHDALALVRAVSTLAHALGMDVAAEGIETDEHLARLLEAECDRGQGYLFSRPLTGEAVSRLLQHDLPLPTSSQVPPVSPIERPVSPEHVLPAALVIQRSSV